MIRTQKFCGSFLTGGGPECFVTQKQRSTLKQKPKNLNGSWGGTYTWCEVTEKTDGDGVEDLPSVRRILRIQISSVWQENVKKKTLIFNILFKFNSTSSRRHRETYANDRKYANST